MTKTTEKQETTEPKFSKNFNAQYNRGRRLMEAVTNIMDNAERFTWRSEFITDAIIKLKQSDDFKRQPIREQCYIEGFLECRLQLQKRMLTHAYLCNDSLFRVKGLPGYEPYAYPSESTTKCLIDSTCVLVWKSNPCKVYFFGDSFPKVFLNRIQLDGDAVATIQVAELNG